MRRVQWTISRALKASELAGDGWIEALHPEDAERIQASWRRSVATGEPYKVAFRIRSWDRSYRWFQTVAQPSHDPDGRVTRWLGWSFDVHEQLDLRRKAEELAADLRVTLESITDAFFLVDTSWRFVFMNTEASRLLGVDVRTMLGREIWDALPVTPGTIVERRFRAAMRDGTAQAFDFVDPRLECRFHIRAFPSSRGLAVYFLDVTAERALVARLREQADMLDLAQDAILIRDLDHTIKFWNQGAERIYGWTRDEAVGRSIRDLLYADPEKFDRPTAAVLADGSWTGDLEHTRKDGETLIVEGRWTLIRDAQGEPDRILAINTDVTDRKRLLQQFLRAQRLESIGTLAGGIAHDLNNVLTPILLSVAVLRMRSTDGPTLDALALIESSAQRGADMVKQVLGFARGYERSDVMIDVARVLHQVARVVRDTFPKDVVLRFEVPDELWTLTGDPTQIHQVLLNLLVNARDAMPEGGSLRISGENIHLDANYAAMCREATPGPYVLITVIDSGTGMSASVMQRIFDPFFTTKEVGSGTGLGLSTVQAIVKSYGGFVSVYSEVGVGTTFRVYLPANMQVPKAGLDDADGELVLGRGELILVVDDERSVREISREALEAAGYRVVTAMDGADAVAQYSQRRAEIALVLTDMLMPIMDGPTTIRALRRIDPEVRIIGASGLGTNGAVARAADAGVCDFIAKPYTAEALLRMVRRVIDEP